MPLRERPDPVPAEGEAVVAVRSDTDEIVMWFDTGNALEVPDDAPSEPLAQAFEDVPTLLDLVHGVGLAQQGDTEMTVAACELVLEALVGRRKISRSDAGRYGRAQPPERRRPNDLFGGVPLLAAAGQRAQLRPIRPHQVA